MCKLTSKRDETSFHTWLAVFWWWTANWFSAHHLDFFVGPPQSSWKSKLEGIQDKVQDCTVVFRAVGTQLFLGETPVFGSLMDKQWYEFWSFFKTSPHKNCWENFRKLSTFLWTNHFEECLWVNRIWFQDKTCPTNQSQGKTRSLKQVNAGHFFVEGVPSLRMKNFEKDFRHSFPSQGQLTVGRRCFFLHFIFGWRHLAKIESDCTKQLLKMGLKLEWLPKRVLVPLSLLNQLNNGTYLFCGNKHACLLFNSKWNTWSCWVTDRKRTPKMHPSTTGNQNRS